MGVTEGELTQQLLALLDEAFEGPREGWSYFSDASPTAGFFGALSGVEAEGANRELMGSSIAAQVQHVVFSMNASSDFVEGIHAFPDADRWRDSWRVAELDEAEWVSLQEALRVAYQRLRKTIESNATKSAESHGVSMGTIAHIAYHLGAVKQKITAEALRPNR